MLEYFSQKLEFLNKMYTKWIKESQKNIFTEFLIVFDNIDISVD